MDGLPLRPDRVTVAFEGHVAGCWLPVIRLHDTRHGACSLMLAGGVPIEIVQMILGHSSPEISRRVYAHLMRKTAAEQVEKASKLLTRHRPDRTPCEQSVSNAPVGKDAGRGRTAERPPCVSAGGRCSKPGERLGGQGRGRTADLPIFSRTLVPTELPGRGAGAVLTGLEPATSALTGRRALQLLHRTSLCSSLPT
jgi:hypothetical protein